MLKSPHYVLHRPVTAGGAHITHPLLRLQMRRSGAASCVSLGPALEGLTDYEMDAITRVFRSFETGLRQATILPKVGPSVNM